MRAISIALTVAFAVGAIATASTLPALAALVAAGFAGRRRARHGLLLLVAAGAVGCAPAVTTRPGLRGLEIRPLPVAGRLLGDANRGLPSTLAGALDPGSPVSFSYDERISQAHEELPFVVMLFTSTIHLLGVPTGRDEVKAEALLTIQRDDREVARYRAEAAASQTYGLYYGASMVALEDEARTAVRRVIDEAVSDDAARLRMELGDRQPR